MRWNILNARELCIYVAGLGHSRPRHRRREDRLSPCGFRPPAQPESGHARCNYVSCLNVLQTSICYYRLLDGGAASQNARRGKGELAGLVSDGRGNMALAWHALEDRANRKAAPPGCGESLQPAQPARPLPGPAPVDCARTDLFCLRRLGGALPSSPPSLGLRRHWVSAVTGIVPAMQPCAQFSRRVAPPAISVRSRPVEPRRPGFLRSGRPGQNPTQEELHGYVASAPSPGFRTSSHPRPRPPRQQPRHGCADGNHTMDIKMFSERFSMPGSGSYPLASYILSMASNISNGAADACGR
jgi:hypothetical protein